ncbi:hypothetical protein OYC64_004959 [Pagothenia borchgrevinki]|uniref:Uncharacterized protein n=1 Tax=Pagothenia borchgrevinki TaxID=8213 RepID=A0ABD2GEY2_PAGBO
MKFPPSLVCVDTGRPADPHRAACRIHRSQLSQFLFPPQPFTQFSGATHLCCRCVRPGVRSPGRMPLEAGVSCQGHNPNRRNLWDWRETAKRRGTSWSTRSWVEGRRHHRQNRDFGAC